MSGPRAILLDWQPIGAGALVGKAKVRLPIGLKMPISASSRRTVGHGRNCRPNRSATRTEKS
jgi:hypothetical protein